jgi:hypothetical protein
MARLDFENLDEKALRSICEQRWEEGGLLDFKQTLPAKDDKGRRELCKDVSAFANAGGGDLLFGVVEKNGAAFDLSPIVDEAHDAAIVRLGQTIDSGVEPRIKGIRIAHVPIATGGYVLVVAVPASFDGPHRCFVNDASRFVMRSGRHTVDLAYQQLRTAFGNTGSLADRARAFRSDRITRVSTDARMKVGPRTVLHVLPMAAMTDVTRADIGPLYYKYADLIFDGWGGGSRSFNLDGVRIHASVNGETFAYNLAFRSGAFESVRWSGRLIDDQKIIPSLAIAKFVREAIGKLCAQSIAIGLEGPAIVGLAVLHVGAWKLAIDESSLSQTPDREHLVLPESWIEDMAVAESDVDSIAKPLLDMMWQSYDEPFCRYYGDGKWKEKN